MEKQPLPPYEPSVEHEAQTPTNTNTDAPSDDQDDTMFVKTDTEMLVQPAPRPLRAVHPARPVLRLGPPADHPPRDVAADIALPHVPPPLLTHLRVFGAKAFARDEGFGGYAAVTHRCPLSGRATAIETCFLWKYVEAGAGGRYAHSIRQALVYQRFELAGGRSTNVLVRMPWKLAARMKGGLAPGEGDSLHLLGRWTGVQMLCAASGMEEWRDFINYLDHEVSKLFDDLILSGVNATTHGKADELQYRLTSMKRLQFFLDQILRTGHMLDVNSTTLEAMLRAFKRRREHVHDFQELQERIEDIQQEYEFLQKMSKSVLERAVMLSHELRDTIALRNHDINKQANDSATQGTHAIVELSRKSAYEARVVKLLGVVAAVYLPASFAADFLQMGYVFTTEEGQFEIHATANLWLYAIFAIPLLIVTLSIYVIFEMLNRRKARSKTFQETECATL